MSKRYGRQQKRQAREALEAAHREVDAAKNQLLTVRQAVGICKDIIDVLYRVNPNCAVLKAAVVPEHTWRLSPPTEMMVDVTKQGDVMPRYIDMRHIDLYELTTELNRSPEFRDAIHVRVRLGNGGHRVAEYGYRASVEGLKMRGAEGIAREIAQMLHRELCKLPSDISHYG